MTPCPARWEFVPLRGAPGWVIGSVYLCAGSVSNPEPCELHGCGRRLLDDPLGPDVLLLHGPCRCPMPDSISPPATLERSAATLRCANPFDSGAGGVLSGDGGGG